MSPPVNPGEEQALAWFKAVAEKSASYDFEFQVALGKDEEVYSFCLGMTRPVHPDDDGRPEELRDYGPLILKRWRADCRDAIRVLDEIVTKREFEIPEVGALKMPGSLSPRGTPDEYRRASTYRWGLSALPWPSHHFEYRVDQSSFREPSAVVARPGLPAYAYWFEAVGDYFGLRNPNNLRGNRTFAAVLYDYRARISELVLSSKILEVGIETRDLDEGQVMVKGFAMRDGEMHSSSDLPVEKGRTIFEMPFEPVEFMIALLDKKDGDLIDSRVLDLRYTRDEPDFRMQTSSGAIIALLSHGESLTTEFKESLTEKEKVLRTIAAFSNTSGGTVVVGVDDHGLPVRSIEPSDRDRLTQLISSEIEPTIEPTYELVDFGGHNLLLVHVSPGPAVPYVVRGRGIFVRRGATSRQVTKAELEEIIAQRQKR